jgi:repressor LexA
MKKPGISQTRDRVLTFIRDFVDDKGYSPTVRDIQKGCSISSTAVVQHHLNILERDGVIHRDSEVFRSIRLMDKTNIVRIPLLGTIAAGEPIPVPSADTWDTVPVDTLELTDAFIEDKNVFALKIKGHSMIDALIDDGDVVIMKPTNSANNGDMVAVWIKDRGEVTLKKIYKESGKIRLQPANVQMKPIFTSPENIEVQGKVVGVIRKM